MATIAQLLAMSQPSRRPGLFNDLFRPRSKSQTFLEQWEAMRRQAADDEARWRKIKAQLPELIKFLNEVETDGENY